MDSSYRRYFNLFSTVSKKIHRGSGTGEILACIVENLTGLLRARGSIYWIVDQQQQKIVTRVSHGFAYQSLLGVDYEALLTIFDNRRSDSVYIADARNDPRIPDLERLGKKRVGAVSGQFFDIVGPYTGILAVYFFNRRRLDDRETEFLTALGQQGAIALQKAIRYDEEREAIYRQIVEGFALAIEAKDSSTHGHSLRVARFARLTARAMNLPAAEIDGIYHAALLHDVGKIGTQDTLLERLGDLSAREMRTLREHPVLGARILHPLAFFGEIEALVRHHHELYDGSGYPDRLQGENIPLGARILCVCDAFETMLAGRCRMCRMELETALAQLLEGAGTRFDPKVVDALFAVIRDNPACIDADISLAAEELLLSAGAREKSTGNRFEKRLREQFPTSF
jgi:putative nucleotidyltransferase with HDIG domain